MLTSDVFSEFHNFTPSTGLDIALMLSLGVFDVFCAAEACCGVWWRRASGRTRAAVISNMHLPAEVFSSQCEVMCVLFILRSRHAWALHYNYS